MDMLVEPFTHLGHFDAEDEYIRTTRTEQDNRVPRPSVESSITNLAVNSTEFSYNEMADESYAVSYQQRVQRQSLKPPTRPRKPKVPTMKDVDWEPYKNMIIDAHVTQQQPLQQVRAYMEREHGFVARSIWINKSFIRPLADHGDSIRQYRLRITQWKCDKNIKPKEMRAIVRKRQERKIIETDKPERIFYVRGREVESRKIDRWMHDYGVSEDTLYAPSPAACKHNTNYALVIPLTTYSDTFCRRLSNHIRKRHPCTNSSLYGME